MGCWSRAFSTAVNATAEVSLGRLDGARRGVSVLTLNLPRTRNALSSRVIEKISAFVSEVDAAKRTEEGTRVLLLASSLPNVFCAGADLRERAKLTPNEQGTVARRLRAVFEQLARSEVPTLAVMEGATLGGGAELALACDLRVASRSTIIGFPECRLAIIPGAGGTQRLPRLVGAAKAKELIFTGRRLTAEEAFRTGLYVSDTLPPPHSRTGRGIRASPLITCASPHVFLRCPRGSIDYVVENDTAMAKALSIADEMLGCGGLALGLAKKAIDGGLNRTLHDGLDLEGEMYEKTLYTKDRAEGVRAFNEKRPPVFTGE